MTAINRKEWGKMWKLGTEEYRRIYNGHEAYYLEFQSEIDAEIGV